MERKTYDVREETVLSPEVIDQYMATMHGKIADGSLSSYDRIIRTFYNRLPEDKILYNECLADFKNWMMENGYKDTTIRSWVTIINGLLEYLKRRDLQILEHEIREHYVQPVLTRSEYLRLLSAAKVLETRQGYLLVKFFAAVSLPAEGITAATVEAVQGGVLTYVEKGKTRLICIPEQLRRDLLDYAREMGYQTGWIFRTRSGRPLRRERILYILHQLCNTARVDESKGNVSCLRQLHQSTCEDFKAQINVDAIVMQMQERLMENEERLVGWE